MTMFHLGRDCLCRKEAPRLGGLTFPLCWRCTGMTAGAVAGCLTLACTPGVVMSPLWLGLIGLSCIIPAGADVFCQLVSNYRSNRHRRLVTGIPLGVGLAFVSKAVSAFFSNPIW